MIIANQKISKQRTNLTRTSSLLTLLAYVRKHIFFLTSISVSVSYRVPNDVNRINDTALFGGRDENNTTDRGYGR